MFACFLKKEKRPQLRYHPFPVLGPLCGTRGPCQACELGCVLNTKLTQSLQQTQASDLEGPMPTLDCGWRPERGYIQCYQEPRTVKAVRQKENHLAEPYSHASPSESTGDRMHVGGGVC